MKVFYYIIKRDTKEWLPEAKSGYTWSEVTTTEPPRLFKSYDSAKRSLIWYCRGCFASTDHRRTPSLIQDPKRSREDYEILSMTIY